MVVFAPTVTGSGRSYRGPVAGDGRSAVILVRIEAEVPPGWPTQEGEPNTMSTLRLSVGLLILMFLLGLVGCSSTPSLRTAAAPKMRTVASIGDKPLPVVTGEPGNTLVADTDPPERHSRVSPEGRISGRVFD